MKYVINSLRYKLANGFKLLNQRYNYVSAKRKAVSRLKLLNDDRVENNLSDIYLFSIMRNESLRLPYFFNYYESLGVNLFFIIDNNSTDSSVSIALAHRNTHVFFTDSTYKDHWYWMEYLLQRYALNHWCIVVDIDELFSFKNIADVKLRSLCDYLDNKGSTALRSLLLDMYSNKPVKETEYHPGENPLDYLTYFDSEHYEITFPYFDRFKWQSFKSVHFTGGMRERVFGKSMPITSLNKFPLVKFKKGIYLGQGMHAINGASVSDMQGIVFHTKFLFDSIDEAQEEALREEHFNNAAYYKDFNHKFEKEPELTLFTNNSIRYQGLDQLIDIGLMKVTEEFVQMSSGDSM